MQKCARFGVINDVTVCVYEVRCDIERRVKERRGKH